MFHLHFNESISHFINFELMIFHCFVLYCQEKILCNIIDYSSMISNIAETKE